MSLWIDRLLSASRSYDSINNSLHLKRVPRGGLKLQLDTPKAAQPAVTATAAGIAASAKASDLHPDKKLYRHPLDRNSRPLSTRYTTERVAEALSVYTGAAAAAAAAAKRALRDLSTALMEHLPAVVQCAHWAVIAQVTVMIRPLA